MGGSDEVHRPPEAATTARGDDAVLTAVGSSDHKELVRPVPDTGADGGGGVDEATAAMVRFAVPTAGAVAEACAGARLVGSEGDVEALHATTSDGGNPVVEAGAETGGESRREGGGRGLGSSSGTDVVARAGPSNVAWETDNGVLAAYESHDKSKQKRRAMGPFIERPSFWKGEADSPAIANNRGYLSPGDVRCAALAEAAQIWVKGQPPLDGPDQLTCKPRDTSGFAKVCAADARRSFHTAEYRRELVAVLHRVASYVGDYHQGIGQIASFVCLFLPADDAVSCLLALFDSHHLAGYFSGASEAFALDIHVWTVLLRHHFPDTYRLLDKAGAVPEAYLPRWFSALFTDVLPLSCMFDFFTAFIRNGWPFLFQFSLALVHSIVRMLHATSQGDLAALLHLLHLDTTHQPAFTDAFCAKIVDDAHHVSLSQAQVCLLRAECRRKVGMPQPLLRAADAFRYSGDVGSDGRRLGRGTLSWVSGETYTGELRGDVRHGHGVHSYANGDTYEGAWAEDLPEGKGERRSIAGDVYRGNFEKGRRSGRGKLTTARGDEYEGEWFEDRCHGHGIQILKSGDRYEGQWKRGRREGKGKYLHADGSVYEGGFAEGDCDGHGIMQFHSKSDAVLYEGAWKRGKMEGQGTIFYKDSSMYCGDFVDARRHGKGVLTFPNGNCYKGDFEADTLSGHGVIEYQDGSRYEGGFSEGLYHGEGKLTGHPVGNYRGDFKRGKKHGQGVFEMPSTGDSYEGAFRDDLLHGFAVHTSAAERWRDEGVFESGVKVGIHQRTDLQTGVVSEIRFLKNGRKPRSFLF